jgi:hypothetical protein
VGRRHGPLPNIRPAVPFVTDALITSATRVWLNIFYAAAQIAQIAQIAQKKACGHVFSGTYLNYLGSCPMTVVA